MLLKLGVRPSGNYYQVSPLELLITRVPSALGTPGGLKGQPGGALRFSVAERSPFLRH